MEDFKAAATSDFSQRELKMTFRLTDKNRDGRICASDMKTAMGMLGYRVGDQQILSFIRRASKGGCDLREEEFVRWMETSEVSTDTVVNLAFSVLDANHDGLISKDELRKGLGLVGEHVSESILAIMMEEADVDNDKMLNFEEFQLAVTRSR